jgi:hypothetical protein
MLGPPEDRHPTAPLRAAMDDARPLAAENTP